MHGTIWKLSAVASVIGIGLLAVVLQQRFGGKATEAASAKGDETASADGANPVSTEDDGLEPGVPKPPSPGGHSEKGPDDGGIKLASGPGNALNEDETGTETQSAETPGEEDAAKFLATKTGTRGAKASINKAPVEDSTFELGTTEESPATPPEPHNSNPRGRRTSQASPKSDSSGHGDGEQGEQSLAIRKPKVNDEIDMVDPLDRTRNRNGRGQGRPNPHALAEENQADQPPQAAIASGPGDTSFNDESQPARPPAPRTGTRSGVGSSSTKQSPHNSFTRDEDESREPAARNDSQIEHQNVRHGPITARGQSEMNPQNASGQTSRRGSQQPQEIEESAGAIVPPVAPARRKPSLLGEDDPENDRPAPRRNGPQRRTVPQTDQPIEKQEQPIIEEQNVPGAAPAAQSPAPRNNRRSPTGLADDEDGGAGQSPPAVPVARQRQPDDSAPSGGIGAASPRGRRNFAQEENGPEFGAGNAPDTNNPNPAAIGSPVPRGRNANMKYNSQADEEAERPEAAASGSTATDVIAPRSPDISPAMPGAARGRARVTIEKQAPPTAVLGQPLIYNIIIRNSGNASAKQVVVEDDVPAGVTVQGSIPQAEMTGQKLKWKIGKLDVGEEQKISVKVVPTAEGPVGSAATVNFVHDLRQVAGAPDNAADAPVSLELQYPPQVNQGQPFEVKFRLTNRTNAPLSNLMILHQLPSGLQHETRRQDLQYEVKILGARESLEVSLGLIGIQSGNAISRSVVITADETILVSKVFNLDVRQPR